MERANKLTCPKCGTPLKSARGVRIGRKIQCPRCAVAFTVRPEDAEHAVGGVNAGRLLVVVTGALLYLSGGALLAAYCFHLNAPKSHVALAALPDEQPVGEQDVGEDELSVPAPPPAAGPARVSAAEQRKIDDAVARGVWWLKDHVLPTKTWGDAVTDGARPVGVGFAALPALTLLECGVPAGDPVVQGAAKYVREQVEKLGNVHQNYQRSLAILVLDRLGDRQDEALIQHLALCLIAAQHPTEGGGSYLGPLLDRQAVPRLLSLLKDNKQSLDAWRKAALKGGTFVPAAWDNSNTQFA
ncbi:MAG TPA: hypothetical protein VFE78_00040, partial [Gemmataceae bacterium]|nr:hypothetical protein [Gemmataceae bacterium]